MALRDEAPECPISVVTFPTRRLNGDQGNTAISRHFERGRFQANLFDRKGGR